MNRTTPTALTLPAGAAALGVAALFYLWHWLGPLPLGVSLHVDEAQYWTWSRDLAWGYYSKPPVIAALIAASTALGGDGWLGVKALPLLLYPLAAGVLGAWVTRVAGDATRGLAAVCWLLASPLMLLLGFAATTDAPLVLCWALATVALWYALRQPASAWAWLALGAAWALGMLSKYTMLAFVPGALACGWMMRRRAPLRVWLRGLLWAGAAAAVLLAPHAWWNLEQGWQPWRHTADITLQRTSVAPERGVLAFGLGQLLLVGPAAWLALRWRQPAPAATSADAARFLLMLHMPLLLLGLLQATRGGANINWAAPAVLGLIAWLALVTRPRWLLIAFGATAQVLIAVALVYGPQVATRAGWSWPARWDFWARMRGWDAAWAALGAQLPADTAPAHIVGLSRDILALGQYHWRDRSAQWHAWHPGGPPRHHYAWRQGWNSTALQVCRPNGPTCVLVTTEPQAVQNLTNTVSGLHAMPLASVTVNTGDVQRTLHAWQLQIGR